MNTSVTHLKKALSSDEPIPKQWTHYFRESLRVALHKALLERFIEYSKLDGATKLKIAYKLGKRPEQVTRWLTTPGNVELDTISDLSLAMGGVPHFSISELDEVKPSNQVHELHSLATASQRGNYYNEDQVAGKHSGSGRDKFAVGLT